MATVTIKKGDTARKLTDTLTLNGSAIDLTDSSVVLVWSEAGTVSRKAAVITDAPEGEVEYQLVTGDVDTAGVVTFEWEITFVDTTVLTVPTSGVHKLIILEDLG